MDHPAIYNLPQDSLHQIFLSLPLRQIILCRSLSKFFLHLLSSPPFLLSLHLHHPPLSLLALRPPHHRLPPSPSPSPQPQSLLAFDPLLSHWLSFPLSFLPFPSLLPVASSPSLVYFWAHPTPTPTPTHNKSLILIACNPLTRQFRALPQLGSAWSRHGTVLVDSDNRVMVLTELAALYYSGSGTAAQHWMKFSSNLPSKPRSPILVSDSVYALCDVGSPWRSQWKLFCCDLGEIGTSLSWTRLERQEWRDVFDILKRPRLVRGVGNRILMVGGLKSSFSLNSPCSTILILRLDLVTLEWDEAGRMPVDMFKSFQESSKFKVFGGGDRVCFSAKRLGKLALWDRCGSLGEWRWIDKMPGNGDGLYRGFVFEGRLTCLP